MRQVFLKTSALASILAKEAAEHGLSIAYDTHYDANNIELSWWQGRIHHRINFELMSTDEVDVTHYHDYYSFLPKLMIWLRSFVPLFPYCARVEWESIGSITAPFEPASVRALLQPVVPRVP